MLINILAPLENTLKITVATIQDSFDKFAYVQTVCLFKLDVNALLRCGSFHIRYTRMSGWQMTVPPFKRRGPPEPLHADETGFDVCLKPKREQRWLLSHTLHFNVCETNTVKCSSSVLRLKGVHMKVKDTSSSTQTRTKMKGNTLKYLILQYH